MIYDKSAPKAKPILKWAGGKTQLLEYIYPRIPGQYGRYIEPFFGGGALFFSLAPEHSLVSDSNPELINLYTELASNPEQVLEALSAFHNSKEEYYRIRSNNWVNLPPYQAAARTIFLNKTCFNGLYRVNRSGQFNVPYGAEGRQVNFDYVGIKNAAALLSRASIFCMDYHELVLEYAKPGDFVFLDPPYVPISEYSDFKRYTKEQFSLDDQRQLARDVDILTQRGCYVMLTNSNHPLVHELYGRYRIEVFQTKRMISKNAQTRTGEDVIVTTYDF